MSAGTKLHYSLGKVWERGWILGTQHLDLLQKLAKQNGSVTPIRVCVIVLNFVL